MKILCYVCITILTMFSCSSSSEPTEDDMDVVIPNTSSPNILFIIADDMGLDATPGYSIGDIKPNMPNLQNLMATGIKFNNLWANPTCTPTRASIITGKYGFRTGVLAVGDDLALTETSLQQFIDTNTNDAYANAVIGKWHLSRDLNHPNNLGVDYYAGYSGGGIGSYFDWEMNTNGTTSQSTTYSTSKFSDLAIDWIDQQTKPWFLWLAYNAPHTPFHLPPNNLHAQGNLASDQGSINANPLPYYLAALEAMDTEMGRVINSLSEEERDNTVIIFIGDNGTPGRVAQEYGNGRTKGSIFQGGVNVPMVISGKGVTRVNVVEDALINTTDLFATIADIAGTGATEINDSKSFKNVLSSSNAATRTYTYTENQDFTIRNTTHKYISFSDGSEALFNLSSNPLESPNLLDANQAPLSASDANIKDELTERAMEIRQ